jgi:segregation and condensation protein A
MEYLGVMQMLDLNIAGEFLVMAATLMLIKSRMLLPVEEQVGIDEEEEDEDDPRWELVRQLVEYKKFKDAALRLQEREFEQENIFGIGTKGIGIEADDGGAVLADISLFDLIAAFNDVLRRTAEDQIGEIFDEQFTVADKIDAILGTIRREGGVPFVSLFGAHPSRQEVICTFLALLELIRLRQVNARQDRVFGEILITAGDEDEIPAEVADGGQ